ncbi:hypothetical protein KR50_34990 [Jeotgalibacillus campisalis]|uniref:Uncharacterized protein n=1 Tax=Jeotgalibacillus campisalis TaxID=220754 RepID=A0A0C2VF02_9BACL|nr:hypothetical protein KR50_34990 [Jeotgalibacillus campisalis]
MIEGGSFLLFPKTEKEAGTNVCLTLFDLFPALQVDAFRRDGAEPFQGLAL